MNCKNYSTPFVNLLLCVTLCSTAAIAQEKKQSAATKKINVSTLIDTTDVAEPLDATVNSPYIESGPMLTKDGKRLYFSRHGHPENTGDKDDQDIWYSDFDDATQSWMEAVNIGPPLNNKGPNFLCGVGWKGDTVLVGNVYNKNGKMSAGISISIWNGNAWSFPTPAVISNDYNFSDRVGFDLSHDRKALVIAQQKDDSYGDLDLYVAFRDKKSGMYVATESYNLGPVINSIGEESSPFLSYDGKTLFFSSTGHKGYGGEDIFMSERLDSTWRKWSKPENLGSGINTKHDDSHFGFTPYSRFAYYSRGVSPTNTDIYQVEMTYIFNDLGILLKNFKGKINPLEIGETHLIRNVFDDDKSQIKDGSLEELQGIFNYLQRFKTMTVHISTHSNKHNTRNESFTLSNARIDAIRDYLEKKGINPSRLNFQGYGHDILVNTKDPRHKKDIASSVEFKFVNYGR